MQTLADLIDSFQLYAVCTDCDRMESVDLKLLAAQLGAQVPVDDVRTRLKCRGCGLRTGDIRIVYVGSHSRAATFHYRS